MGDALHLLSAAGATINVAGVVGQVGTRIAQFAKTIENASGSRDDFYLRVVSLRDVVVATGTTLAKRNRERMRRDFQGPSVSGSDGDDEQVLVGLLHTASRRIDDMVSKLELSLAPFAHLSSAGVHRFNLAVRLEKNTAGIERAIRMIDSHIAIVSTLQISMMSYLQDGIQRAASRRHQEVMQALNRGQAIPNVNMHRQRGAHTASSSAGYPWDPSAIQRRIDPFKDTFTEQDLLDAETLKGEAQEAASSAAENSSRRMDASTIDLRHGQSPPGRRHPFSHPSPPPTGFVGSSASQSDNRHSFEQPVAEQQQEDHSLMPRPLKPRRNTQTSSVPPNSPRTPREPVPSVTRLTALYDNHKRQAEMALVEERFEDASKWFDEAIGYAKQRQEFHGHPFEDRFDVHYKLVEALVLQCDSETWQHAEDLLHPSYTSTWDHGNVELLEVESLVLQAHLIRLKSRVSTDAASLDEFLEVASKAVDHAENMNEEQSQDHDGTIAPYELLRKAAEIMAECHDRRGESVAAATYRTLWGGSELTSNKGKEPAVQPLPVGPTELPAHTVTTPRATRQPPNPVVDISVLTPPASVATSEPGAGVSEREVTRVSTSTNARNDDMINQIIRSGENIEEVDPSNGRTPLLKFVARNEYWRCEQLITKATPRPNLKAKDKDGRTVLHLVTSEHGDLSMLQLLLFHGADPNAQDDHGDTALHLCATYGRRDVAQNLINMKADLEVTNKAQQTPLLVAKDLGDTGVFAALIQAGAKVDAARLRKQPGLSKGIKKLLDDRLKEEGPSRQDSVQSRSSAATRRTSDSKRSSWFSRREW